MWNTPQKRGWTLRPRLVGRLQRGCPALAGDGPAKLLDGLGKLWASPHPRGWTFMGSG